MQGNHLTCMFIQVYKENFKMFEDQKIYWYYTNNELNVVIFNAKGL